MRGNAVTREAIVREQPHIGEAAWGMFRSPTSYAELAYHSKIASHFQGADGGRWFARARLIPASRAADEGRVDTGGVLVPPELIPRRPDDDRSRTFLHEELATRLTRGPIEYLLQLQLRPVSSSTTGEEALDCTRPWGEAWRDVAALIFRERADEARVDALHFDPFHAPNDLALPLARSAEESASLGHLRSIVYEMAAQARSRASRPSPARKRRVCVVGGGGSGLAAAWALERAGHEVTVLERSANVAGKCASLEIDGRAYDWGGHLCTGHYTSLAAMASALGVPREPATPTLVYDIEARAVMSREDNPRLLEEVARYQSARERSFRDITEPGLRHAARALAAPIGRWIRDEGLLGLGAAIGVNYTSCGYGFLDDEDLAALYVVKAAEMGGILSNGKGSGLPPAWSLKGGFGAFWQRVAGSLRDVRRGVAPIAIERRDDRVIVQTEQGRIEVDDLVMASPLDEALAYLDASDEERDLFSRIRYLDYHTVVCRAEGLPRGGFYLVKQHCEDKRHVGHAVAFHHRYDDSDVYLFYTYGTPGMDLAALEANLRADAARMGGRLGPVLDRRRWRYFPHVSSGDIEQGYFDRLEALQGTRRTCYVGSLLGFELIECNVGYAHQIVDRFFAPSATPGRAATLEPAAGTASTPLLAALRGAGSRAGRAQVLAAHLQRLFTEELELAAPPGPDVRFLDLGLDSVKSVEIFQRLAADTGGQRLAPVIFFDYPTLAQLSLYLADELATDVASPSRAPRPTSGLAPRVSGPRVTTTSLYEQVEDVVFADRHGVALPLDVFAPRGRRNGLAVVDVASALWSSGRDVILGHKVYGTYDAFCERGFTVFAVRPGSASRFSGEEMVEHVREAVRWVKANARDYGVDAERVGLLGGSAGGHLACLAALTPSGGDAGFDSAVHALVAHCPMTRYRVDELDPAHGALLRQLATPGGGVALDSDAYRECFEALSPIAHVRSGAPPALLFHARHDKVVPFEASEAFVAALQEAGASAELVARDSHGHPWPGIEKDMIASAVWMESALTRRGLSRRALLRVLRPVPAASLRLVCFHHAGGSSAVFESWPSGLPHDVEVIAVELPGRGARAEEAPFVDLATAVAAVREAVAPLADRPLVLFGHSLGAVLAFEVCHAICHGGGRAPAHLFVSGFVGPRAYDPSRALEAEDIGPGFDLGGPGLEADFRLFRSWRPAPASPLDVPITAFGGALDPFAPRDGIEAWRSETRAAFAHTELDGHHFTVISNPTPLLARLTEALEAPRSEGRVERLAALWRARPHALEGAWNAFDLAWLGRPATRDGGAPAFPEAIAAMVSLQRTDGGIGARSSQAYCNLVTALAFANTLLRWNADGHYMTAIERALASAVVEYARVELGAAAGDRYFHFHGFFGRWLVPARECQILLDRHGAALTREQRRMAEALAAATGAGFERPGASVDYARLFDEDSLVLHFAEYFPDEAFRSEAAVAHAERTTTWPGLTAAAAARHFEVTRDPRAEVRIRTALRRPLDGLRPGGRLQELQFALAYLVRGGVDPRRAFAQEVDELQAALRDDGVGVEPGARTADCDASAVSLIVAHRLGLRSPMPTRRLEAFWDAEAGSYASADGHATYTLSTTLHVLEAYLAAPDATADEQRAVWTRVTSLLAERPWVELHHLSPLYIWEKLVSIVGAHAHRFPDTPTRAHLDALAEILARQHSGGGFRGALDEPTLEESALGLLALRSALAWPSGVDARGDVERAAVRARAFVVQERLRPARVPELWVGKLVYAPVNVVDAIVTAALAP
jgi:surfactin synthase thioesterase subunit